MEEGEQVNYSSIKNRVAELEVKHQTLVDFTVHWETGAKQYQGNQDQFVHAINDGLELSYEIPFPVQVTFRQGLEAAQTIKAFTTMFNMKTEEL